MQPKDVGGAAWWASLNPDGAGKPLAISDLQEMLGDLWKHQRDRKPRFTAYVSGYFAEDEPDHDDAPLTVGDRVRLSLAIPLFTWPDGVRPYINGVVESTEPWSSSLAGKTYVRLEHGPGAWWERERLLKVSE